MEKITPETFTSSPKPPEIKKTSSKGQKIPDSLEPKFRHKAIVKYRGFKQSIKNKVHRMFSKQTEKAIRNKVTDNTLWGKILFGVLDAVSVPQMHEIWKAVQKEIPNGTFKEKMKLYWEKVDGVRTLASVAVSVITAYLVVSNS